MSRWTLYGVVLALLWGLALVLCATSIGCGWVPPRVESGNAQAEDIEIFPTAAAADPSCVFAAGGQRTEIQTSGGSQVKAPATTRVRIRKRTAEGGSAYNAEGADLSDLRGPTVDTGGVSGGGGFSLKGVSRSGTILIVIGGLALLAGVVVLAWLKRRLLGAGLCVGGGLLIASGVVVESYPWAALVALALMACGAAVLVWDAARGGTLAATLRAVVLGVEKAPTDASERVKRNIGVAAEEAGTATGVRDAINRIKKNLGIRS